MRSFAFLGLLAASIIGLAQNKPFFVPEERDVDVRLFAACREGKVETVRTLLAKGANPNAIEANGWTPLMNLGGPPESALAVAKLLVSKGANVNARQPDQGGTPLTEVLGGVSRSLALVEYLLLKGANPNTATNNGTSPLAFAVQAGDPDIVALLLAGGAHIGARTNDRADLKPNSPGLQASERRGILRNQAQLANMFEPGFHFSGETPLFGLAGHWNLKVAALLIRAGASLKDVDDNGWTVLHYAVQGGKQDAVLGLIALGADPNAASRAGFRPLHVALREGFGFPDARMVRLLLDHGADPALKNAAGQSPLDLLRSDAQSRLGNPTHDPQLDFPEAYRVPYLESVNAAAKALDPKSEPVTVTLPKSDPKGTRYTSLDFGEYVVERAVRIENGRAVLELRLPPAAGASTLTVKAASLENYDTITHMPVFVHRTKGAPQTLRFEFPIGAAKGGAASVEYEEKGPGSMSMSGGAGDEQAVNPGFAFDHSVAIFHDEVGRILEFQIVSATRAGKPIPGLAGQTIRIEGGKPAPIPGLMVDPKYGSKSPKVKLVYRYRLLPNVKWHTQSADLP